VIADLSTPGARRSLMTASTISASDSLAAGDVATAAGQALVAVRASGLVGAALGNAGDLASQGLVVDTLARRFPSDAILSEEGSDDLARLTNRRVWIVDPLDGTREFTEPGRDDWAVHVALVVDGALVAGAVALPARRVTLTTATAPRRSRPASARVRMVVSRTRPGEHARHVAEVLGADLVPMGSAGAKAMAVVLGEGDVYLHLGGQYEWDSAAPAAVAAAAGLHVSRLDGSPLRYNQPNPWLPDLLVCVPEVADAVLDACAEVVA